MPLKRARLVVVVALWAVFLAAMYGGVPPNGHSLRPLLWVTMVLVSLRIVYGAVRSNKRPR